jgi:cytochrome c oxidase assembly protein subunit 15
VEPGEGRRVTLAYDWMSLTGLASIALGVFSIVLMFAWWRGGLRHKSRPQRVAALVGLTLFLCFDLIVFGAFTRLSDSGLGCPDWPGCYATSSPVAAARHIAHAEALAPQGPVTERKAWIEMIHRYFAGAVLALVLAILAAAAVARQWRSFAWACVTLLWILVQIVFGALTVTLKLYPAIVTGHLLLGMGLLALLAVQRPAWVDARDVPARARDRLALWLAVLALALQIALGGWVSTNYAVLACTGFPQCNGQWWPAMNWSEGFTFARELGRRADGTPIAMTALVAIQWTHRLFALVFVAAMGWLVARLWHRGPTARRRAVIIGGLVVLQLATGLSNVVLGWPLVAALAHTAGAAALVVCIGFEVAAALNKRTRIPSP